MRKLEIQFLKCGLDGTHLCGIAVMIHLRYDAANYFMYYADGLFSSLYRIIVSHMQNFEGSSSNGPIHIMHLTRSAILDKIM